jgi:hypothetical protein
MAGEFNHQSADSEFERGKAPGGGAAAPAAAAAGEATGAAVQREAAPDDEVPLHTMRPAT